MEVGKLTVKRRHHTGKGTARKLRAQGRIPGVCYGAKLEQPLSIEVDAVAFRSSLDPVRRQNTVIELRIEGDGNAAGPLVAMVKDFQVHPLRREITHLDLLSVDTEKPVEVRVPLELTGKSKGVVTGGQIHMVRHELTIRCKPTDIPPKLVIDITELDVGGVFHVADLSLPAGVSAETPAQLTVVTCSAPPSGDAADEEAEAADGTAAQEGQG